MKKWLWIGLLMGLIACGSSSNGEENTDTTSPSDSVSNDDTSNPPDDSGSTPPDTTTPPDDSGTAPTGQCWIPDEVVSTMDCDAICANTLQCDPDDECEIMCPLVGKYLSEAAGTSLTECMTKPCAEFEDTDFFPTCANHAMWVQSLPGVEEGKDLCTAGKEALAACPTVDPSVGQMFQMGCIMVVPLFSDEAQAKIAACTEDPCSFLDCAAEANCFLADMFDDMPDDHGGPEPPPGPGPEGMCWVPDKPDDGYNLDCNAFCEKAMSCSDVSPMECDMYCVTNASYVNETMGPLVDECIASSECNDDMGMALLPLCLAQVAGKAADVPEEGEAICGKLSLAIQGCPDMAEFHPLFQEACKNLATLATLETMEQLATCADFKCDATMECVTQNNCMFMTLLSASMIGPSQP